MSFGPVLLAIWRKRSFRNIKLKTRCRVHLAMFDLLRRKFNTLTSRPRSCQVDSRVQTKSRFTHKGTRKKKYPQEVLAELPDSVTPAEFLPAGIRPGAGVQRSLKILDSDLRRNATQQLLQEARQYFVSHSRKFIQS